MFLPAVQAPPSAEAAEFVVRTSSPPAALIPTIQRAMLDVNTEIPTHVSYPRGAGCRQPGAGAAAGDAVRVLWRAGVGAGDDRALWRAELPGHDRQAEFGIRMALGADRASILRLVMQTSPSSLLEAWRVGSRLRSPSVKLLQGMLFGLEPRDR